MSDNDLTDEQIRAEWDAALPVDVVRLLTADEAREIAAGCHVTDASGSRLRVEPRILS